MSKKTRLKTFLRNRDPSTILKRGGLGRNLIAMIVWQGANYLAPLLTFPHLTRVLHPTGFGQYGIYLVLAGYMTIVSDWGTNYTGSRLISQERAKSNSINIAFWSIFFLRILITVVIAVGLIAYVAYERPSASGVLLLFSAWLIIAGNALTVSWCLQGLERLDAFATAALVGRVFTVPVTLICIKRADQVWLAVAVQGMGGVLIGLTSLTILYRSGAVGRVVWSWRAIKKQALDGVPVLASTASHGLYSTTATTFLGLLQGPYAAGIFVAADRLKQAVQGLIQPVHQVLYPRVSRLAISDRYAAVRTVRALLIALGVGMSVIAILLALLAPLLVHLVAGPRFGESTRVLIILSAAVAAFGLNAVLGWDTLMPFGYSKEFGKVSTQAAAVNIVIMPILVYLFSFQGAAVAVFITELFILQSYTRFVWKNRLLSLA